MLLRIAYTAAVAFASLFLLVPATAGAQSSQGAVVNRLDECVDFGEVVVCTQGTVVAQTVMTPTGQLVGILHMDYVNNYDSVDPAGCDSTQHVKDQEVTRIDTDASWNPEGIVYVGHFELRSQCASGIYVCEDRVMGHYVNGTFQFTRHESVCEEET